ncbi:MULTISPECIES: hypothetical protein [unclassified Burkholderia]|uniref:hypothetical protein n=1 Tax=unclassified Burkholderia TaxID=2613784 RepID=UPI0014237D74|nr:MULTISPECIES: hypothetical protein [unclassified Burkholderia]NIE55017.1 hypothetical protein [Burkholderia sp. Ap-955]NIF08456.1 hypothetical protein [Burkholderia sp. Ax-1735]NIG01332.1 hypothetical protein [Burkholderia sp. Tr-849]
MSELQWISAVNKMENIFFGCMFAAISMSGCASPADQLSGEWDWDNAPSTMTFSIDLKQQGGKLKGQYCAVAQNGKKTDCDDESNPNIYGIVDGVGKSAVVNFSSFFGAKNGKATLKIIDGHLVWHIIKSPFGGEFYAPKDAVLTPH